MHTIDCWGERLQVINCGLDYLMVRQAEWTAHILPSQPRNRTIREADVRNPVTLITIWDSLRFRYHLACAMSQVSVR